MSAIITIVKTIDKFIGSSSVIGHPFQYIDTVRKSGDIVLSQMNTVAVLIVEFESVQADVVRVSPCREQLKLIHDWVSS